MTGLLEIREKIKLLYSRNEMFVIPVVKFLLAFLVLTIINGKMGYMSALDSLPIVLIVSLMCSFLPVGMIILFSAVISLLHMYALSMEVALVGLCLYLLMYLLFFRFSPRDSLVVILTPLLFAMKIPYIMPIAAGLVGTPASVVSVGCGVIVYYFLSLVMTNAKAISGMESGEAIAKIRIIIDGLLDNRAMLVMIAVFAVTIIVVYLIRRMSVDYAWTIAIVAGAIVNVILLLVGDLVYDTNISMFGAILGTILAVLVAKVLEFFRFCVDYSRTEKVQFEDDEYYYYVKAVPKMTVAAQTKTVKKINTQRRPVAGSSMTSEGESSRMSRNTVGRQADMYEEADDFGFSRSVVTERTAVSRNASRRRNTGRSVGAQQKVSTDNHTSDETEGYEDIEDWE